MAEVQPASAVKRPKSQAGTEQYGVPHHCLSLQWGMCSSHLGLAVVFSFTRGGELRDRLMDAVESAVGSSGH